MSDGPVGVAIVGAGVISAEYLATLAASPDVRVLAIGDLDTRRARAVADAHGVPVAGAPEAVLALDGVEIVVNLTPPAAHVAVGLAALEAGRHVYSEKPLALDPAAGQRLLAAAAGRGLRVGCAPDTFLGAGIQSARRALDAGLVGTPVAVSITATSPGPERWHPRPEFLFAPGAGPLFDIGPYYLTATVALLGPVARVAARARTGRAERVVGAGLRAGARFAVRVPTHVTALADLAGGASAAATFSFDTPVRRARIEIAGSEGMLALGDPIFFGGPLEIRGFADDAWRALPLAGTTAGRGVGVIEMAQALRAGRPHRAGGEFAQHVLDVMTAIATSAERAQFAPVPSSCARPAAMPPEWDPCVSAAAARS